MESLKSQSSQSAVWVTMDAPEAVPPGATPIVVHMLSKTSLAKATSGRSWSRNAAEIENFMELSVGPSGGGGVRFYAVRLVVTVIGECACA